MTIQFIYLPILILIILYILVGFFELINSDLYFIVGVLIIPVFWINVAYYVYQFFIWVNNNIHIQF
jgi:hypothetical protein